MAAGTAIVRHSLRMMRRSGRPAARRKARRWHRSPLMRRLLAVNLLALVILAASLLYLGGYKRELIETELRLVEAKGRTIAVALGHDSVGLLADGEPALDVKSAEPLLRRLIEESGLRVRLRVRVFGRDGALRLDSRRFSGFGAAVESEPLPPAGDMSAPGAALRWMLGLPDLVFRDLEAIEPYRERAEQRASDYREIEEALRGETDQVVRSLGARGLMLSVALPIRNFKRVVGAALVSADGRAIDEAVGEIRLNILAAAGVALVATVLLTIYMARGIARPLRDLAATAERIRPGYGRVDIQDLSGRNDEIGDLSAALRRMTHALWDGMEERGKFAADVSHELRTPLASAYSAAETAIRADDPEKRHRLIQIILDDVRRLNRLIDSVADVSSLGAQFSRAETRPVDMRAAVEACIDAEAPPRPALVVETEEPLVVHGLEDQLTRVVRNLIDNARSFSPAVGSVRLALARQEDGVLLWVDDDGPGIQAGKEETIFERFYSDREDAGGRGERHSGLGLAIARDIARLHGGSIGACNRQEAGAVLGARFELRLPAADG